MTRHIKYFFVICLLFTSTLKLQSENIVFDLGDVLVQKSHLRIFWYAGYSQFMGFHNPLNLEERFFEFLHRISPPPRRQYPLAMYNNHIMPTIMQDWLAGLRSNEEILSYIICYIDSAPRGALGRTEKRVFRALAKLMFDPTILSKIVAPTKQAIELLKACAKKTNSDGSRKNKIYILSNWDSESYHLMIQRKSFKKLFKYVDGIIISGIIHKIKPEPDIFPYTFEQFNIDPDKELTVYVDDDKENLAAAESLCYKKLITIHCKNVNLKHVKTRLHQLGIL